MKAKSKECIGKGAFPIKGTNTYKRVRRVDIFRFINGEIEESQIEWL